MLGNLTIKMRLIMLVVLLLALSILIGGLGMYATSHADAGMADMYEHNLIPTAQLGDIASKNLRNRLAVANAVIQPEHIAEDIKEIEENRAAIQKIWDGYLTTPLTENDKILVDKFAAARKRFVEEGLKPAEAAMKARDLD
jgi:ribosomal protein S17E